MADITEDLIYRELAADERLLWTGRPRQGFYLQAVDVFLVPFSLLWGGFAIFLGSDGHRYGCSVVFSAVWHPIRIDRSVPDLRPVLAGRTTTGETIYAVTSQRVLILSGLWTVRTTSLNIETLSEVSLSERDDGTGTITFGAIPFGQAWLAGSSWPMWPHQMVPSFEMIVDVRRVYETIRSAQKTVQATR